VKTLEVAFCCPNCGAVLWPLAALVDGHMCSLTPPAPGPVPGTVAITQVAFPGAQVLALQFAAVSS
jgi:hypothetical protein